MFEPSQREEMQSRFGDRFSGMELTHVEQIHWPVWVHDFSYEAFESVFLDALEEGLLLLVQAGVESVEDLASLLGCSERYAHEMIERLGGNHQYACIRVLQNGAVSSTGATAVTIANRARQNPVPKSWALIRDAIFDSWLSYGDSSFARASSPTDEDSAHAWLEAQTHRVLEDGSAGTYALTLVPESEVGSFSISAVGRKEWVSLWLGCYQPAEGNGGRFLLFNPSCEDSPLPELSVSFEQELRSERLQLYFQDDASSTASLFWESLSKRLQAARTAEELEIGLASLIQAENRLQTLAPTGIADRAKNAEGENEVQAESDELRALRKFTAEQAQENIRLRTELHAIPRTQHIEASQHPQILVEAIDNARAVLILICPWIRMSVLRPLLPKLDRAMERGCEIFIGYGMPINPHHPDNSDKVALDELRKREKSGMLRLHHLNTHEKVIVQDDERFVTSSFNFLSYTGGDKRRESGTLWMGNVGAYREKFLLAFAGSQGSTRL